MICADGDKNGNVNQKKWSQSTQIHDLYPLSGKTS